MTTQIQPGSPAWLTSLARDSFIEGSGLAAGLRAAAERIDRAEAELFTAQQTIIRLEQARAAIDAARKDQP
jgi:hypothetical protein